MQHWQVVALVIMVMCSRNEHEWCGGERTAWTGNQSLSEKLVEVLVEQVRLVNAGAMRGDAVMGELDEYTAIFL
jgi:hypothetical protein